MFRSITVILSIAKCVVVFGQLNFSLGQVTEKDFDNKNLNIDSSAVAVVLAEFGNVTFGGDGYNSIFYEYYIKIRILKPNGLAKGNFEIVERKSENTRENLRRFAGASHNHDGSSIISTMSNENQVFIETNERYDTRKLTVPKVKVGSVIEITYVLESPFTLNFRPWEFQSDIPKVLSEFHAKIPAIYVYNVALRGFLELTRNKQTTEFRCITSGGSQIYGFATDCNLYEFAIEDIPAFVEEEYMTSKQNFLSALRFELSQRQTLDGTIHNFTKEWKDATTELRKHEDFGFQLKRCKDLERKAIVETSGLLSPLDKAKKVYKIVQDWYTWNEHSWFLCDKGTKKAFETRTGNIAEINLSLVAALRAVGLKAEPMLLSTRDNGVLTEFYPVLTEFNYVLATVQIEDQNYILDGSDDWLPFGMIPDQCLNGKGRVFEDKNSYWMDLKATSKDKLVTFMDLTLGNDNTFRGKMVNTYGGYGAYTKRVEIAAKGGKKEYLEELQKNTKTININEAALTGLDNLEEDVRENFAVEIEGVNHSSANMIAFSPFFSHRFEQNPFRLTNRLYPVDFAVPIEIVFVVTLAVPENYEVTELPESTTVVLPNSGGRFLFDLKRIGDRVNLNYSLTISRTIFLSQEYSLLREFFSRIVQVQNFDLILKKKS